MAEDLRESLTHMNADNLRWYRAALPGVAPAATRKADLVAGLEAALADPNTISRLWDQLSPEQRPVVAEAAHGLDGRYDADVIQAMYPGTPRPKQPTYGWGYSRTRRAGGAGPLDLLFCAGGAAIPRQMLGVLKTLAPRPAPLRIEGQSEPPSVPATGKRAAPEVMVAETERAALHDLTATLRTIQAGKIAVGTTRQPTLPAARLLRERLRTGDYFADAYERSDDAIRPVALVILVQAAGWARAAGPAGGKLALTRRGQAVLTHGLGPDDARTAWQAWLASDLLDELSRVRGIKGQRSRHVNLTKPSERRERLPAILGGCPVGRWVGLDDLFRYARARRLVPVVENIGRTDETGLYVGSSHEYGWLGYEGSKYREIVGGSYLRAALLEYAATLGAIDVAYTRPKESRLDLGNLPGMDGEPYLSRYDGLLAVRLTALGAYLLGLAPTYQPPAEAVAERPAVRVLPNLDVVVVDPAAIAPVDRALLEQIGEHPSAGVYHLDRARLLKAAELGTTVDQVRQLLVRTSCLVAEELPQTVRVFLADVERRAGLLRETGRWIAFESDDPYLLTELANSSALRGMVRLATLGEQTVLLVAEARESAARRQLKKLGYAPSKG